MARGGKRLGAGNKPKWNSGKTKVVRVPESIADQVIEYARSLDTGQSLLIHAQSQELSYDSVTQSKTIDLSGVLIRSFSNQPAVLLSDLIRIGYRILPEKLMQSPSLIAAVKRQERTNII